MSGKSSDIHMATSKGVNGFNLLPLVILSKIISITTDSTVQIKAFGCTSKCFNAAVKICLGASRCVVMGGEEVSTSKAIRHYFDLACWASTNKLNQRPFIPFQHVCQLMASLPVWESIRDLWPRNAEWRSQGRFRHLLNSFPVPDHHHDGFILMLFFYDGAPFVFKNDYIRAGAMKFLQICLEQDAMDSYKKFWMYVSFSRVGSAIKILNFALEFFFAPVRRQVGITGDKYSVRWMGGCKALYTIDQVRFQWPLNIDLRMLKDIVRDRSHESLDQNVYVVDGFIGQCLNSDMMTEKELDIVKRKFNDWVTVGLADVRLYHIRLY